MKWITSIGRICGVAVVLSATSLAPSFASADNFPQKNRSISLIVPYGAGGMVDVMGRALAAHWDAKWGTRTVVLNKPGANGQLAFAEMLKQKADGYTIVLTQSFDTQMTYLDPEANAPFSRSSFMPVGLVQSTPAPWVVRADSPYKTVNDLIDAAKARPHSLNFGSPASRGPAILYMNELEQQFGAKLNVIPFNDVPSTVNALLGGHIDAATANAAVVLPHVNAGRLRVLMVAGDQPLKYFPDAPPSTAIGIHLPDFSNTGMALKSGTSPDVLQAWSSMLAQIAEEPALRSRLDQIGVNLAYMSPSDYTQLWLRAEDSVARVLMKLTGKTRQAQ